MAHEELSGSPVESFSESSGPAVARNILVPYSDRFTIATAITGGLYPQFPDCRIQSMRISPYAGELSVAAASGSFTILTESADYAGKLALLVISYGPDFTAKTWPTGMTKPAYRVGTELRFQTESSADFLTINSSGVKWEDDADAAVNEDIGTVILVPTGVFNMQWDFVNVVPKDALDALVGKINDAPFLGVAAGSLLFEGYRLDETFKAQPTGSHTNRVSIRLLKREYIADDTTVYGWNYDYREDPAGWAKLLLSDGEPRYKEETFTDMFV